MQLINVSLIPNKEFFDNYAEAVVVTASSGEFIYLNYAFTELTGFDEKDGLDIKFSELLHGTNGRSKREADVISFIKRDGDRAELKVSVSSIKLYDNSGGKVYTFRDYSDVMQLRARLRESDARFSLIADALPVMIHITNSTEQAHYFNKAWLEFTGKTMEAESGDGWMQNIHPDDLKSALDLKLVAERMEPYSFSYRLRRADGVYRMVYGVSVPRLLTDSFGGYINSFIDISEMEQLKEQLVQTTKKLEGTAEELEQLAYVASHDLQEPLRTITSYIQLIHKNIEKGNTAVVSEFMKFVLDGASRMQGLINDLLQFSRVGKKGAQLAEVDMNQVIKTALTHLQVKMDQTGAVIEISEMPRVLGDNLQLVRLVQNLVDNALKFISPECKPEIKISVQEDNDGYTFAVRDNGIGLEEKFYSRIFVIFQRLHGRGEYEGTGVGLAIAKKIVERHGGEIWVKSEKGRGSVFYFTLKKYIPH